MLFIPGNNPGMLQNAALFKSDSIIFDLEDAVSLDEKDSARILVASLLRTFDFSSIERVVRVNQMDSPWWREDIEQIALAGVDTILIPKADQEAMVRADALLNELTVKQGIDLDHIQLMALIETASGVEYANDIVTASERITGVLFGGEDYTADLGIRRTREGGELAYARARISNLCHAETLSFIDTPFADTDDVAGLIEDCKTGLQMGATGKAAINPRQIKHIHKVFSPSEQEIAWANGIMRGWQRAKAEGKGVFSLNGKMVDAPIILRAQTILDKLND
jgi:citrate lyase subunit beta/citryl-CoA lyase